MDGRKSAISFQTECYDGKVILSAMTFSLKYWVSGGGGGGHYPTRAQRKVTKQENGLALMFRYDVHLVCRVMWCLMGGISVQMFC